MATDLSNFDQWHHHRVAMQDVSIHVRYWGSGPPLLLVHGNPQYSLTWRTIGPILAKNFTVIAPDNRGAGNSSIPPDDDYTAETSASDLKGVLDSLNISQTYVFAHDKGVGIATALAVKWPALVKMLGISEYALPGFGYDLVLNPTAYWDLYANWQLAFFSVTDAAAFFIAGKERQMLEWYFFHSSYSGSSTFPTEIVDRYAASISKPGFLRAMLGPFSTRTVQADAKYFVASFGGRTLQQPVLALGGEASFGTNIRGAWESLASKLEVDAVPKAGHWFPDENPFWTADRLLQFFGADKEPVGCIDLSDFTTRCTLSAVGSFGTLGNQELAGA